jgi:hypothetical protein
LNYFQIFCQSRKFLSLALLALFLCSCTKITQRTQSRQAIPVWFEVPEDYVLLENDGRRPVHAFFDFLPERDVKTRELNMVVTTPIGYPFGYELDLYSGKLFRRHRYCSQDDAWGRGRRVPTRPPVTLGFVPRLLDQAGEPQMVALFGRSRYLNPFTKDTQTSERVKIVGGGLLQYCRSYPCERRERWLSRLVLIAVNPMDPNYKNIRSIDQLRKRSEWQDFITFMENGLGKNISTAVDQPAYRFTGDITAVRAFEHAFERGYLFNFEAMSTMRRSCHALYDLFWESSELVRSEGAKRLKNENQALAELKRLESERAQTPSFLFSNVRNDPNEQKEQPSARVPITAIRNYPVFFNYFFENYGREYRACSRFVRDSNLRLNPDRHWYFAFVNAYLHLEDEGMIFLCSRRTWVENLLRVDGTRVYDPKVERANCLASQFDVAFDRSLLYLIAQRRSYRPHVRYLEFDGFSGGSHQTLYSWVFDNGKRLSCDRSVENEHPIFPDDIAWKPFYDDELEKSGIIR